MKNICGFATEIITDDKDKWDKSRSGDIKKANAINCGLMTMLRNAFSLPVTKREFNDRIYKITISI